MLASAVAEPFDSSRHLFEPKWDGYRCLAFVEAGVTRLQSRNLRDITDEFPSLAQLHRLLRVRRAVVDGEITAWEGGRPSFSALQARAGHLVFVAFDLLEVGERELLARPLEERRDLLERLVAAATGLDGEESDVVLSPVVPEKGRALFGRAAALGLEGVVGKELGSPYLPGRRTRYWLKVKVRRTADCVIAGYRLAPGGDLGTLVLAVPQEGGWRVVGHVGTGWDRETGRHILSLLEPGAPPPRIPREFRRGVTWVRPKLVCSVAYLEVTGDGMLRQASFLGLRPDLEPAEAGVDLHRVANPAPGAEVRNGEGPEEAGEGP